jgi:hypothetical protein
VVPRGGKFLALYKRNGHRAIVNRSGAFRSSFLDGWGGDEKNLLAAWLGPHAAPRGAARL